MENFDSSQLLVIDGTDMIKQPWVWAQKAQVISAHLIIEIFVWKAFVGVREVVTEQNFIFNEETGYYCYMPPNDSTKYCLTWVSFEKFKFLREIKWNQTGCKNHDPRVSRSITRFLPKLYRSFPGTTCSWDAIWLELVARCLNYTM